MDFPRIAFRLAVRCVDMNEGSRGEGEMFHKRKDARAGKI